MDQPDPVSSHNREAWDAQVERGNPLDIAGRPPSHRGCAARTFGGAVD